jgi:hypothetical protein
VSGDPIDRIRKASAERGEAADRAARADMFWRWEIERQVKAGVPVAQIAEAAGISRQRVYQIRDGKR